MIKFQNFADLKVKSVAQLRKDDGKTCSLPGCSDPLTPLTGIGSNKLCKEHQKMQREFGGPGRLDRPWTFQRAEHCIMCGRSMKDHVRENRPGLEESDFIMFSRMWRTLTIGDHKVRQVDGGGDGGDNVQTLCLNCNGIKTVENEDWKSQARSVGPTPEDINAIHPTRLED